MGIVGDRLAAAGFAVPALVTPVANYVPAVRMGDLVFTSGQLPLSAGELIATGHVGSEVTLQEARECAVLCALNALAAASTVCELDEVAHVVKLVGYVASAPGFGSQPAIIDAASEVLIAAFGDAGRHAREAVGVAELPLGAPVELSLVLSLSDIALDTRRFQQVGLASEVANVVSGGASGRCVDSVESRGAFQYR